LKKKIKNEKELEKAKRQIAKETKKPLLTNADLLKAYHKLILKKRINENNFLERILRKRKIRSLSGIVVVSVLTKPYPCPGKCLYCPNEKEIPKSYLSNEPAVMRAILNNFDPYLQTRNRLKALEANGHPIDKIDIRIIGATWSYYPSKYQKWFITRCFQAVNDYPKKEKLSLFSEKSPLSEIEKRLKKEQKKNEKAKNKIIGITIETRPDYINKKEIKKLRELGITRVELGVQSIYDHILKLNKRGHFVSETIKATSLLKNHGFKICYQIMPNLPGSNIRKDKKMFEEIFENPDFRPDFLKIYPCLVLKEAPLYKKAKKLNHQPYSKKQLIDLIKFVKKNIPYYIRIQRIIRDIPSNRISMGPKDILNLRQIIHWKIKQEGWRCKCIRCREVKENYFPKENLFLFRQDYSASRGKEIFLSYENKRRTRLYSLLRLRIPDKNEKPVFKILENSALIRELHTYGLVHSFKKEKDKLSPQHKGLGKKLMKKAEEIAKKEFGLKKIAVISGIGVRQYYRKLGYKLKETYMIKYL